ncbi:MAG: hypothetical protein K8L99_21655, partial [Anaerolineae bacterium]|nr:hypothetical protein [Anaerolineae bacterium]
MATTNAKQLTRVDPQHHGPNILLGGLVGLLITIPLVAIFFLADIVFGLPFVPFDVFDWTTRNLPGELITFGIDNMVNVITSFNLGETSSAAKTAEHTMAIAGMVVTGIVAVAILFFTLNRVQRKDDSITPGLALGLIVGAPVMLISNSVNFTASANPFISAIWILVAFLAWGVVAVWIYNNLASNISEATPDASAEAMDRRSFLIRVGGATATITLVGAGLGAFLRPTLEPETSEPLAASVTDEESQGVKPDELPNADAAVEPVPGTRPEYT